jgi:large subunit ribosomal protein L29
MKIKEIRALSAGEIEVKLKERVQELFNLRFQHATGQLENTARVPQVKKEIARLKTVLGQKAPGAQKE